jgi:2-dehydropantoate 2-reductase
MSGVEMKPKTIGIIGAGPVGGILAAHLLSAGHNVVIVDSWKDHLEHIRTNGLKITGREELQAQPIHLFNSVEALDAIAPEFVFICTKACDLESVLSGMSSGLKESETVFISAQNGIDTEQIIAERIDPRRVLRAVISFAGNLVGPGEIRETFFTAPNYLGWLDEGGAESCRVAAEMVSGSGLATDATGDIKRFAWRKSILNTCTMSIAAVTGMNMQEMVNFPPTAHLVELLLRESIAVAEAYGFDYGPGFIEKVRDFNQHAGPHRPSMLVDLENGRKTENGVLMRRIAEYGERKGVPVPLHRTLANLIDALEQRNLERSGSSPATARL